MSKQYLMPVKDWGKVRYFSKQEIACKCGCQAADIDARVMYVADIVRAYTRLPMVITSGVRCAAHNKAVGGAKDSAHVQGFALDIQVNDAVHRRLIRHALSLFGDVIGIGQGENFIHFDIDTKKPKREWLYK
ncbi:MAG: serine/threonine protein kinase [Gammaproteobacteria bacterium]|nr:MAG: serine/threonine protein kinase [Gammaproteobacteria bacterium]